MSYSSRIGAVLSMAAAFVHAASPELRVQSGFAIERVSGPALRFPMFATLDNRRCLYVTESSGQDLYTELREQIRNCRISRLEDRDGDGRYEIQTTFADQLVPSMGLVWHTEKLFAADPPDLITLEDTDGDGQSDKRTVILTGFGHTDNGSLHGLIFGPDNWLYFTTGQPDGYRFRLPDGTLLEGRSGALLRCRSDGTGIEVVARGFENLVEISFLPTGDIIGTDNWFQLPADGRRDALVHLVEGGLYPLQPDQGTPQPNTGNSLPPLALYPAVALSGLEQYRGRNFPPHMHGSLFSAGHNSRKIVRHELSRFGATFRSQDEDFVWTDDPDFHPSDVLQDSDGSLLVVDTGSWYTHHCPTGRIRTNSAQGGIFRIRCNGTGGAVAKGPATDPADSLAAEAWSAGRRGDASASLRLVGLLDHPAPHVEFAAAQALATCGRKQDVPAILARLARPTDPFLEHALVHALLRLADLEQLIAALENANPRIQRAAVVLLDQPPHNALPANAVIHRLASHDESLRRVAEASLRRHADWIDQALPILNRIIGSPSPSVSELGLLGDLVVVFGQQTQVITAVAEALTAKPGPVEGVKVTLTDAMKRFPGNFPVAWRDALNLVLQSNSAVMMEPALRVITTLRLDGLDNALQKLAGNPQLDRSIRVMALRALTRNRRGISLEAPWIDFLFEELGPGTDPARRLGAVEVLTASRLDRTQFARFLRSIGGDSLISPKTVLEVLPQGYLGPDEARVLLQYLEGSVRRGSQLAPNDIQRVRAVIPGAEVHALNRIEEEAERTAEKLREELNLLEPLLRGGDANRGRVVFESKAGCIACHRVAGRGGVVGPDLTSIGAIRAGRDLIESLVMPSATFSQGYETYTATLGNDESVTGVLIRQPDAARVLRDVSGAEMRLPENPGVKLEQLQLSLMPEGLLDALSQAEIRDLLAYLQRLGKD